MSDLYKYRYTRIGTTGCIPTHKIFINTQDNKIAKFVFADDTFIYGVVSDWFLRNSDFDTRRPIWSEESPSFIENEKRLLEIYKASHPLFKTEINTN
ncbi:hypothetical protein B9T31_05885 [Acinetobacter sp. ANC 4558]|uniref:hypothetical protein n=1 Tax=Acinetobacter sp. ANC 4558 TaxID=1977876 RepID=UPI000A346CD9|nr:hypothetical protein [Acinetobacter sp. ANC 4558]OTG87136.1 hypothetical protein B9T31_05885 [Acinetobacter sp. ANC 4558]